LANFYQQCEKLTTSTSNSGSNNKKHETFHGVNKRRAPIANLISSYEQNATDEEKKENKPESGNQAKLTILDSHKEIMKNSVKVKSD
jgi:hypothetical protein